MCIIETKVNKHGKERETESADSCGMITYSDMKESHLVGFKLGCPDGDVEGSALFDGTLLGWNDIDGWWLIEGEALGTDDVGDALGTGDVGESLGSPEIDGRRLLVGMADGCEDGEELGAAEIVGRRLLVGMRDG